MQITKHFTLEEMCFSEIAIRNNIDNTPNVDVKMNLVYLCNKVLEPIRSILGVPIKINSGYRCIKVNSLVGGVSTSQHVLGQAADTVAIGITVKDYYAKIKSLVRNNELIVDQLIWEYNSWVHISYKPNGNNRNQFLIKNTGTNYIQDNN